MVGVNTAIYSPNGGSVGIAFAIPAVDRQADRRASSRDTGTVTRGFLGVSIQDVNRDLADSVGLEKTLGALVTQPTEGGPAAKAGLKSGDVIIAGRWRRDQQRPRPEPHHCRQGPGRDGRPQGLARRRRART